MEKNKSVLISGASFAGLSTAYWMNELGYDVTVVEIGSALKMGGTPVDIKDQTVEIIKRMGLFEQIKANRLGLEKWEFKNSDDVTVNSLLLKQPGEEMPDDEFEIERDVLLHLLYDLVKHNVTFIFNNSIKAINEEKDFIDVTFKDGSSNQYDLLFGCDGIHSLVRKIWFGGEDQFVNYLGQYFSIGIVEKYLIPDSSLQLYAEPNKGIMLNSYRNKTDIVFIFRPEEEISYDFRDQDAQKQIVYEQFSGMAWRAPELQEELLATSSFYFDKFCQVKMPSWSKGRVVLVGDAGYCASPAAGMGGSLAIIGATAVSDALRNHGEDYKAAFSAYEKGLRPYIDQVQADAIDMLDKLLPRTQKEIDYRNQNGF